LKTDAPILIGAPQKIEDPGLCRDPFQFEASKMQNSRVAKGCGIQIEAVITRSYPLTRWAKGLN
jgi:hypothetical protein